MLTDKILVPTDGSEHSLKAARSVVELVKKSNGNEIIVFVVESIPKRFVERHLYWVAEEKGDPGKHIEELFAEERNRILEETAKIFEENGISVKTDYAAGNPAEEICEYARKNEVTLIAIGSRGVSNIGEIFMGSVSHKVLHLAPCPVLLIR